MMDAANKIQADKTHSPEHRPAPLIELETPGPELPAPGRILPLGAAGLPVLPPPHILALQRAAGNRAVSGRLQPTIQAKLTVGPADDVYEQEADRVADQVIRGDVPRGGDALERGAKDGAGEASSSLQPSNPAILREPAPEEDELQAKRLLQRQADTFNLDGSFEAGGEVERRLAASQGSGQPLAAETRAWLEPRFGVDFSGVRVHTGGEAARLNRKLSAQAFTYGQDIYFGAGRYETGSQAGRHLLAHELTHVVQQAGRRLRPAAVNRSPVTGPVLQRLRTSRLFPEAKFSEGGDFILKGRRELYATPAALKRAAAALAAVNALVTLKSSSDKTTYLIESQDYVKVELAINPAAVIGRLWTRLQSKQPAGGAGYRSFADCFRTSATVSGINPGMPGQKEELRLPTTTLQVKAKLDPDMEGVDDSPAARAAASFFLYAFPVFLGMLQKRADVASFAAITSQLERFGRSSGRTRTGIGPIAYKAILANPVAKTLFSTTFGINEAMAPAIGTAITQVNDPAEKAAAESRGEEKWNFHWAGVILADGADYVTLENCAVEIPDATAEEMVANADIVKENDPADPQKRTVTKQMYTKQDLINDRWYFRIYGKDAESFHSQNLADTHATPSAITLPVSKG